MKLKKKSSAYDNMKQSLEYFIINLVLYLKKVKFFFSNCTRDTKISKIRTEEFVYKVQSDSDIA